MVPSSPHHAADTILWHGFADEGHGERHHGGGAEPLGGAGGDQQRQRGCEAAERRGGGKQRQARQQQPAATEKVAEAADAGDQHGAGQKIGEHHPLDLLEGGGKHIRQRRQGDIGDAGAERGQKDAEREAGERTRPAAFCRCGLRVVHRLLLAGS
jgi:hypothetical protein